MIVVYGSTSSGKSNIAENIAVAMAGEEKKLFYLATMENKSEAAKKRIAHHKKLREGKGFITIEEETNPSIKVKEENGVVLLECVSNLVANILFDEYGEKIIPEEECDKLAEDIYKRIILIEKYNELVVVTNNVFGCGKVSDEWCDRYMKTLGRVNELLAAASEKFIEVTAGTINVF